MKSKWKSSLALFCESRKSFVPEVSSPGAEVHRQRAAKRSRFKVQQSAEQLKVRKNVLVNGFDSSTENQPFFKLSDHKCFVAPFLVKSRERG